MERRLEILRHIFHRLAAPFGGPAHILFSLDTPGAYDFIAGGPNVFSGIALAIGASVIRRIEVIHEGRCVAQAPVDREREDISGCLPHIPAARRCGFRFECPIADSPCSYMFRAVHDNGKIETLFEIDPREALRARERDRAWLDRLDAFPMPPPEMVHLTQGIADTAAYKASILPGLRHMRAYLETSGVAMERIGSLLDFGCGSGRLMCGWHAAVPGPHLEGCDINATLIDWAARHLPPVMRFSVSGARPPLAFENGRFDLIYGISVFTHLSLESQRAWLREFRRILKPDGHVLLTLHGDLYVEALYGADPNRLHEYKRTGYLECIETFEGGNSSTSFHRRPFAQTLFSDFHIAGYFPQGRRGGKRVLYPLAASQDVYVLRAGRP